MNGSLSLLINMRDKRFLSPSERADFVTTFLFNALDVEEIAVDLYWDLVCFHVEALSLFAFQTEDKDLLQYTSRIKNHIYNIHYQMAPSFPQLGGQREDHKKKWLERISKFHIDESETSSDDKKKDPPSDGNV